MNFVVGVELLSQQVQGLGGRHSASGGRGQSCSASAQVFWERGGWHEGRPHQPCKVGGNTRSGSRSSGTGRATSGSSCAQPTWSVQTGHSCHGCSSLWSSHRPKQLLGTWREGEWWPRHSWNGRCARGHVAIGHAGGRRSPGLQGWLHTLVLVVLLLLCHS